MGSIFDKQARSACQRIDREYQAIREAAVACRKGDYRDLQEILSFLRIQAGEYLSDADPDRVCELENETGVEMEEVQQWLDSYEATSVYIRFCLHGQGGATTPEIIWEYGVKRITGLVEILQVGPDYQQVYFRACQEALVGLRQYGEATECTREDIEAAMPAMP